MSFLGDLVGSIGGERPPAPHVPLTKPLSKPTITTPSGQTSQSKSAPSTPATARPAYKGTAGLGAPQQAGNLKRKAEEISTERAVKLPKTNLQSQSDRDGQKPSKVNSIDSQTSVVAKSTKESSVQPVQNVPRPPAKPPAKSSYAAMMARAKDAQSTKAPSSIGVIKHQPTEKAKVSKLAERKRQEQEKEKEKSRPSNAPNAKTNMNTKSDPRRRSVSPVKKAESSKQARAPQPPLHGPRKDAAPAYKGTLGQAPKNSRDNFKSKRPSRYDEYLGTDEEEDDDDDGDGYGYDDDDVDGYSSEGSADMEAGWDDIEMEDQQALKAARDDDAKEAALENRLKLEKEERKRKLAAMAKKHR